MHIFKLFGRGSPNANKAEARGVSSIFLQTSAVLTRYVTFLCSVCFLGFVSFWASFPHFLLVGCGLFVLPFCHTLIQLQDVSTVVFVLIFQFCFFFLFGKIYEASAHFCEWIAIYPCRPPYLSNNMLNLFVWDKLLLNAYDKRHKLLGLVDKREKSLFLSKEISFSNFSPFFFLLQVLYFLCPTESFVTFYLLITTAKLFKTSFNCFGCPNI